MIEEIIRYTTITKNNISILDLNLLRELNNKENFLRGSSLNRSEDYSNISEILDIFQILNKVVVKVLKYPKILEICILDNKGIIGQPNKGIYSFKNNEFNKINITSKISRKNLFIQEELHDFDGIIFFLWDISILPKKILDNGRFYKEILILSGFLGQILSKYTERVSWKGTLLDGVNEADWKSLAPEGYQHKLPILAYAFQFFSEKIVENNK